MKESLKKGGDDSLATGGKGEVSSAIVQRKVSEEAALRANDYNNVITFKRHEKRGISRY